MNKSCKKGCEQKLGIKVVSKICKEKLWQMFEKKLGKICEKKLSTKVTNIISNTSFEQKL